jgi:hypothetical protein
MILAVNDVPNTFFEAINLEHWFSDVKSRHKLGLWNSNTQSIICLSRVHHIPQATWTMTLQEVSHRDAGGMTDCSWSFYHYTRDEVWQLFPITISPPWDLCCTLSTNVDGRPYPSPKPLSSGSPKVVLLWPNTYDGSGILCWSIRGFFIINPYVVSPISLVRFG